MWALARMASRPSTPTATLSQGFLGGDGRELWVYSCRTTAGAALLIGILARNPVCLGLCRLPGLQAIGRISYGGYVLHVPVLMVFAHWPIGRASDRTAHRHPEPYLLVSLGLILLRWLQLGFRITASKSGSSGSVADNRGKCRRRLSKEQPQRWPDSRDSVSLPISGASAGWYHRVPLSGRHAGRA